MTNSALIDLSWFGTNNPSTSSTWESTLRLLEFLGDRSVEKQTRHHLVQDQLANKDCRDLYLLERLFEFDRIMIDGVAYNRNLSFRIPSELDYYFEIAQPDVSIYENAASDLRANASLLPSDIKERLQRMDWWEKTSYHDGIWGTIEQIPSGFADSTATNDWMRAFFYLSFSKAIDATPLLSGSKAKMVNSISKTIVGSQHQLVTRIINDSFSRGLTKNHNVWDIAEITSPPIIDYVLHEAIERDISALDLMEEVRASNEAVSYRNLLKMLRETSQKAQYSADSGLHVALILEQIAEVAHRWGAFLDKREGIDYTRRTLKLSKVPAIGKWLELGGMDKHEIKDLLIDEVPGYLVFCSTWYKPNFDFGASHGFFE